MRFIVDELWQSWNYQDGNHSYCVTPEEKPLDNCTCDEQSGEWLIEFSTLAELVALLREHKITMKSHKRYNGKISLHKGWK
jgi:hypothetical protein